MKSVHRAGKRAETKSKRLNHDVTNTGDVNARRTGTETGERGDVDNDERNKITHTILYRSACIP